MNYSYPQLLSKINEFIQKFYLNRILRGSIYAASVLSALYLVTFLLVYYLHPGVTAKTVLFFSYILIALSAVFYWIVKPALAYFKLSKVLSVEEAASLIGDHFFLVKDKLLNTLQLKALAERSPHDNALILAGIDQKITELRPIPFSNAIQLGENRRYLKYFIVPAAIILMIAVIFPAIIKEGTYSFVKYNTEILPKAPFDFQLLNKSLRIVQGDDLNIQLKLTGDELPQDVYLVDGENMHKLEKKDLAHFNYTLKNVRKDKSLRFSAGGYESFMFHVAVIPRPSLLNFTARLQYPAYLQRKEESVQNIGDMLIPEGTKVTWSLASENASSVIFEIDAKAYSLSVEANRSSFSTVVRKSQSYTIKPKSDKIILTDSLSHHIDVIKDAFPGISVTELPDSLSSKALYFSGNISDDHGFSSLKFHYNIKENGRTLKSVEQFISIKRNVPEQSFFHLWNLNKTVIAPGQILEYYFEVADNDGVNGAKKQRSAVKIFQLPSAQQVAEKINESSDAIKQKMESAIKMAEKVEKESKKIAQTLLDKKQLSFDDKKQIEQLLDKQKQLEKAVEEIKKLNEKNSFDKEENQALKEELAEKQKQIDNLFNNVLDEKTKALLEQLQKLLDQNNKDQTQNELSKMQMDNKSLKNELDRILELYKQLEFEQNLQENIDRLKDLAKKQNDLSRDKESAPPDAKARQQELSKQFEDIKKNLESLDDKNKALERANNFEKPEKEINSIKDLQKASEKQLEQNQKEKAAENQEKAADEMQKLSKKMENMQQEAEKAESTVNALELRRLLENLLNTSFDQEAVMLNLKKMTRDDASYTASVQKQRVIKDNMKTIADSLYSLSKRVPQIESTVNEEMQKINFNIDKSLEELAERRTMEANKNQQYAMTSVNNLALMLNEALEQLQNAKKNGKGGKGKKQSMQELQKMQQELNKKMQNARDKMEQSGNKGTVPKGQMSEEFARMAQEQEMIREALQKINQQDNKDGSGKLGNLNQTIQDMKKTENELVNKRLERETLNRQKDVLTKLLEAEKAERDQDESEKRESTAGKDYPPSYNQMLEKYNKLKKNETEWLQKLPPDMNYYYKNRISEYFKSLNSPSKTQ